MQGQSVVANVVRIKGASEQTILSASMTYTGAGQWAPAEGVEYHGQSGPYRYEAALSRTAQVWDDLPGNGYRVITAPGRRRFTTAPCAPASCAMGYQFHGGLIAPLWGGDWNNNLTLQTTDYPSGVRYYGYGGSRFDSNHPPEEWRVRQPLAGRAGRGQSGKPGAAAAGP